MEIDDLVGSYLVEGRNQEESDAVTYHGKLNLQLDHNRRIVARWTIGDHIQSGTGFFKNDILVINFSY